MLQLALWLACAVPEGPVRPDTDAPAVDTDAPAESPVDAPVDTGAPPSTVRAHPDFNGDGHANLALGAPGGAGAVYVAWGGTRGPSPTPTRFQRDAWAEVGATRDALGASLAAGDLDDDGFDDLAIGAPGAAWVEAPGAGRVLVLYGGPAGMVPGPTFDLIDLGEGLPVDDARLGSTLAIADFDGDGVDDLAVTALQGGPQRGGRVHVLRGSSVGLDVSHPLALDQGTPDLFGEVEPDDRFGAALAAADLDGDGYADLAVGVPNETYLSWSRSGYLNVLWGSPAGLAGDGEEGWFERSPGVWGITDGDDAFGAAIAAGDAHGDGAADLFVSAITEGVQYFTVLEGGPGGLHGDTLMLGAAPPALLVPPVTCDVNGDGADELVTGGDEVNLWGGRRGNLDDRPVETVTPGDVGQSAWPGRVAVGCLDLDADGYADVVLAAPDAGALWWARGRADGLGAARSWEPDLPVPADLLGVTFAR